MGMFSSANRAISSTFDIITDVAEATGKTVSMATTYVDNRATKQNLTDKQSVMLDTAKHMATIQAELNADEDLAAIFKSLETEFK
jgi:hypothetical protein